MPSPEVSGLKQKAVLWAADGYDSHGEYKVDAAAEIDVRWEDKRTEPPEPGSGKVAVVAIVTVAQDVAVGSIMWLGRLKDVADPPVDLCQVVDVEKIPSLKARHYLRVLSLTKYSNELPELA